MIEKWRSTIEENGVRVSMQVRELVDMREGFEPLIPEPWQAEDVIVNPRKLKISLLILI